MIAIHVLFVSIWIWLSIGPSWAFVHNLMGRLICLVLPMVSCRHWSGCVAETRKGARTILLLVYVLFLFPFGGVANLWRCDACDNFARVFPPHSVHSLELSLVSLASLFIVVFFFEVDHILLHHPNPISHRVGVVLGASILLTWMFAVASAVLRLSSVWVDIAVISVELLILIVIAVILNRELQTELRAKLAFYAVIRIIGLLSQLALVGFLLINDGYATEHNKEKTELLLAGISAAGTFFAIGSWIAIDIGVACYAANAAVCDTD